MPADDIAIHSAPTKSAQAPLIDCRPASSPRPASSMRQENAPFTILVVDDEKITRRRLERLLNGSGYQVKTAGDGRRAINLIRQTPVDLVLSDIKMPIMDGFQMARTLRQMYGIMELPIIMMTSSEGREQVLSAFDFGANDYIRKPIDNDIVLARIKTQLLIKNTQRKLRDSEERYALASRGTNDGIWDWNLITKELYLSARWREMVGAPDDWNPVGNQWMQLIHYEDRNRVMKELESHLCGEVDYFETELRMQVATHEFRWMLCRGIAVHDAKGIAHRIAGSLTDITEGKVADALTGLPNRVLFYDRVEKVVEQFNRHHERKFGLIYMDIDGFKLINDQLGHEIGDEFLVEVSTRINSTLRKSDAMAARLGGDEFAVLIENVRWESDVIRVAERIHEKMSTPFQSGGREILTRASMGIVFVQAIDGGDPAENTVTTKQLISQADAAMYRAKKQSQPAYCVFKNHMLAENAMRLELGGELRHAIKRNELSVHYQPIIDLKQRKTIGFEALLRWNHPVHGNISPVEFIPIAEANGLIIEIGEWVLREACQQTTDWNKRFEQELTVSVNMSIRQLTASDCLNLVSASLKDTRLPPKQLRLELTESLLMQDTEETIELLCKFRDIGIKIGLDDFGTGYSSLAYLHQIPMDTLKIDRSFIANMNFSEKNMAIIRSIIALAESLNLQIVAEGIETTEQLLQLKSMGVQLAQGYLLSRPIPAEQAEALINKRWELGGMTDVATQSEKDASKPSGTTATANSDLPIVD